MNTTVIHKPHDGLFHAALNDIRIVREFLACYLPEHLLPAVDFDTLKLQPQSFIDSRLRRTQSDILYQAQINNETAYIYLLIEHWSRSKPLLPFTVHKYNVNIWDS